MTLRGDVLLDMILLREGDEHGNSGHKRRAMEVIVSTRIVCHLASASSTAMP